MKNLLRIPGFPPPEKQDEIKFYIFKNLPYTNRMLFYLGFIILGFVLQIVTLTVWPGAILLIFAALLNMVKGYKLKAYKAYSADSEWAKTNMEKVHQVNQVKASIDKWDIDALDITNGLGCFLFGVIAIVLLIVFIVLMATGSIIASIFFTDAVILIVSLWFNGLRIKGNRTDLYIKTDLIIELERFFEKVKMDGESFIPAMMFSGNKSEKPVPRDCRFNIVFDNMPADFYGIQAQINLNVVDTIYPYFYCVVTAKEGFGLEEYMGRISIPQNITMQHTKDGAAEVIVIRQYTTRSSGYHTKINACKNILEIALNLSRLILERNKQ